MVQISQRGKAYLETAQTLLRAAKTMTDSAIAGQLKALADDYQRRAEKASHVDAAKAFARSAASPERKWCTWPDGQLQICSSNSVPLKR
jgi:soluble lytic murein transglycosylase-like protein